MTSVKDRMTYSDLLALEESIKAYRPPPAAHGTVLVAAGCDLAALRRAFDRVGMRHVEIQVYFASGRAA